MDFSLMFLIPLLCVVDEGVYFPIYCCYQGCYFVFLPLTYSLSLSFFSSAFVEGVDGGTSTGREKKVAKTYTDDNMVLNNA